MQSLSQIGNSLTTETKIVAYNTRINRDRPAYFVFLIYQSGSMKDAWGTENYKSNAQMVALYVNNVIHEIIKEWKWEFSEISSANNEPSIRRRRAR